MDNPNSQETRYEERGRQRRSSRRQRFRGVGADFATTETAKGFGLLPNALWHPKRTFYNLSGLIGLVALLCVSFEGIMYGLQSPADRANYRPFLLQHITFTGVDGLIGLKNSVLKSVHQSTKGTQPTPPPDEYEDGDEE
ncbi:MAG: hypothetical protein AAF821_18090 [Cyanobacteria bacterium P01_D01_bin.156]